MKPRPFRNRPPNSLCSRESKRSPRVSDREARSGSRIGQGAYRAPESEAPSRQASDRRYRIGCVSQANHASCIELTRPQPWRLTASVRRRGLTDLTLSCAARAHVPEAEAARRSPHFDSDALASGVTPWLLGQVRQLGCRASAGPRQLQRRVRPPRRPPGLFRFLFSLDVRKSGMLSGLLRDPSSQATCHSVIRSVRTHSNVPRSGSSIDSR